MATKSFITRLNALETEYKSRIHSTFEKLRAIETQPYYDELRNVADAQKSAIKSAALKAFKEYDIDESNVNFFEYGRSEIKVSIGFTVPRGKLGAKTISRREALDKLIEEGQKKFCPIEKGYHRRLHEWKERCLVDGEIYAFESPTVEDLDKFDSIGCA